MEGRYDIYTQGSCGWSSMRNDDFQEDEIWAVFEERNDFGSKIVGSSSSFSTTPRPLSSAARMIPPRSGINNPDRREERISQQSAPVNIPDWTKIYARHSEKASKNSAWSDYQDGDGEVDKKGESWDSDDEDEEDDEDGDGHVMMPPHEWIARKLARSQISSFSVCEGAGRTLKGRDLSRVRNAVLTKTGFLE